MPDLPSPQPAGAAAAAADAAGEAAPQEQQPGAAQQQPEATAPGLVGWRELRQRLVEAGANPAHASEAWASNHYRWVVWKLARLQLLLLGGGGGGGSGAAAAAPPQLLTAAVVLDELKLRWGAVLWATGT